MKESVLELKDTIPPFIWEAVVIDEDKEANDNEYWKLKYQDIVLATGAFSAKFVKTELFVRLFKTKKEMRKFILQSQKAA